MKKLLLGISSLLFIFNMSSCSEDFDVAAPYKDITVVYGLLDVQESAQYIRIQKAFLDQKQSSLVMAKVADSNYYRSLDVVMKTINNGLEVGSPVPLILVNLDTIPNHAKQPGIFFNTPNLAYRLTGPLNPSYQYRLVITNKLTGNVDSAITSIINSSPAQGDRMFYVSEFNRNNFTVNFAANKVTTPFVLNLATENNKAAYFEAYIDFHYQTDDAGVKTDKVFSWNFGAAAVALGTPSFKMEVPTSAFYPVFKSSIPAATSTQIRYIDSADVYVWAADQNYYNYLQASQLKGGITADQVSPIYTTIQGKNALGLFGSRTRRIKFSVPLDDASVDSLRTNQVTRDLGFDGRVQ